MRVLLYNLCDTTGCCVTPAPVNIPGPQGPAGITPITGTATLVGGTVTISAAIDAGSIIILQRVAATGTSNLGYTVGSLVAQPNVAAGSFVVNSYQSTGAIQSSDTGTFTYFIYG